MENYMEIIKIIMCFIVYSFFGWVMESVLKTVSQRKPVNSGFLYGPFCPIYGFGAMIMLFFLSYFKDNLILLFFARIFCIIPMGIHGWMDARKNLSYKILGLL